MVFINRNTCWACVVSVFATGVVAVVASEWFRHADEIDRSRSEENRRAVPVQVINDQHFDTDKVKVGGRLVLNFNVSRTESCRVTIHRFIVERATGSVVWSNISGGIIAQAGDNQSARLVVALTPDIGPGLYDYRAFNYNECDRGRLFTQPAPPLSFEIEG